MKKISNEFVKSQFSLHGCQLLDEYINARVKMKYRCKCGNIAFASWDNFSRGHKCAVCAGNQKLTQEQVAAEFSKCGFEMIGSYEGSHIPIKFMCSCGNESSVSISNLRRGTRCSKCRNVAKPTQQDVEKYFLDEGCELLDVYKNALTNMRYKCQCGNIAMVRFATFKKGNRCRKCFVKNQSGINHHNWLSDREEMAKRRKFRKKCYGMLWATLNAFSLKKLKRTHLLLGYTAQQLREHIEQHPNWKFLFNDKWHLDHIFPIQAFVDYGISDIKLINRLDNLQPLSVRDNLKKHDDYDKKDFENWLLSKNINFLPK